MEIVFYTFDLGLAVVSVSGDDFNCYAALLY